MPSQKKVLLSVEFQRMRENFTKELKQGRPNHQRWDLKRIASIIQKIEDYAKDPIFCDKNTNYYYYYHMYDIKMLDGKKVLTYKKINSKIPSKIIRIAATEEYFDILLAAHYKTAHGGREKMQSYLKNKVIIPATVIASFQKHCGFCESKKAVLKGNKPVNTRDYRRGFLHIVDMSDHPDKQQYETFKYILYYQDNMTKFSYLRELTDDSPSKIADTLLEFYLGLGGAEILSTTRDTEFTEKVIERLTKLYPNCVILIGKPIIQEIRDECDVNIKGKIFTWMEKTKSSKWSLGIRFVEFEMNSIYDEELERTPFKAMFGVSEKKGVNSKTMQKYIYMNLKTEEDLKKYRSSQKERKRNTSEKKGEEGKNNIEEKKSSDAENSPIPGCSEENKIDWTWAWCWVCGTEDEGVTKECHSCKGAIHNDCGQYKTSNIICNLCLAEEQSPMDEQIQIKVQTGTLDLKLPERDESAIMVEEKE